MSTNTVHYDDQVLVISISPELLSTTINLTQSDWIQKMNESR